jgi:hypothetical protein
MTNEEVKTTEQAFEKVRYYVQRWKIERFHHVLKSGRDIEKLQERNYGENENADNDYSVISVFIMNLTYIARVNPELPCGILFDEADQRSMRILFPGVDIKNILHTRCKLGVCLRWDTPFPASPGFQCVFLMSAGWFPGIPPSCRYFRGLPRYPLTAVTSTGHTPTVPARTPER